MKKILNLLLALLLPAALCLPASAQEDGAAPAEESAAEGTEKPAAKPAAKKPAPKAKAKKKKKKKAAPVSEYKFTSADAVPTYKFDKKANPIVKPAPKKKGGKAAAKPADKLPVMQKAKYINEESATKTAEGGQ